MRLLSTDFDAGGPHHFYGDHQAQAISGKIQTSFRVVRSSVAGCSDIYCSYTTLVKFSQSLYCSKKTLGVMSFRAKGL